MIKASVRVTADRRTTVHAHLGPAGFEAFMDHLAQQGRTRARLAAYKLIYGTPEGTYKRTWQLWVGIMVRRAGLSRMIESRVPATGSRMPYSVYVHEGTSRMSARPYLKQGLLALQKDLGSIASAWFRSIR